MICKLICLRKAPVNFYDMTIWLCSAALELEWNHPPVTFHAFTWSSGTGMNNSASAMSGSDQWNMPSINLPLLLHLIFSTMRQDGEIILVDGRRFVKSASVRCLSPRDQMIHQNFQAAGGWLRAGWGLEHMNAMQCHHLLLSPHAGDGSQYVNIHLWSELVTKHPTHLGLAKVDDAFTLQKMKNYWWTHVWIKNCNSLDDIGRVKRVRTTRWSLLRIALAFLSLATTSFGRWVIAACLKCEVNLE